MEKNLTIREVIGNGKPFEPPFKVEHEHGFTNDEALQDNNGRILLTRADIWHISFDGHTSFDGQYTILQHICDLLNREHCNG